MTRDMSYEPIKNKVKSGEEHLKFKLNNLPFKLFVVCRFDL